MPLLFSLSYLIYAPVPHSQLGSFHCCSIFWFFWRPRGFTGPSWPTVNCVLTKNHRKIWFFWCWRTLFPTSAHPGSQGHLGILKSCKTVEPHPIPITSAMCAQSLNPPLALEVIPLTLQGDLNSFKFVSQFTLLLMTQCCCTNRITVVNLLLPIFLKLCSTPILIKFCFKHFGINAPLLHTADTSRRQLTIG
jgi:hypothetical protein